jgi:hypothetical protein
MEEELFKLNPTVQVTNPNSTVTHLLTKREYFAAMAMQGLLSIYDDNEQNPTVPNEENVKYMAKLAVQAADSLIAELNK